MSIRSNTIREAEGRDACSLERLYKILMEDESVRVEPQRIGQIKADPHNFLFVLERNGEILASSFLALCPDPMFGFRPFGVIENVIVDPSVQGEGIGSELLVYIEAVCRKAHCTEAILLSSKHRIGAHKFFAKMGYSDTAKKGFVKSFQ